MFARASGAVAVLSGFQSAYNSTDPRRKFLDGWRPPQASANQSVSYNLSVLVNQCRHVARTTPLGRSVCEGFKADVVGTGISLLPRSGDEALDKILLKGFLEWAEHAGINGESLWELQWQAAGEYVEAGAVLWRILIMKERLAEGKYPLVILPLDVEWLSEIAVGPVAAGCTFVRGIEQDKYGRPQFYHIRNPEFGFGGISDFSSRGERIPASEIIHSFERRRALQTHGEPLLAPAIERIYQDGELVTIELKAANNTAAMAVAITSDFHDDAEDADGNPVTDIPLGATVRLHPGEKAEAIHMERPNQLIAPFRSTIRGDVAASCRVSQYWLDRDSSRANYSSARMDQLLSKRLLNPLKQIAGTALAGRPYEMLIEWIMLRAGKSMPMNPQALHQLMAHEIRPDQPEYVDPLKDAEAAAFAIQNNLTTLEKSLADRGMDMSIVLAQRAKENAQLAALGLPVPGAPKPLPGTIDPNTQSNTSESDAPAGSSKKPKDGDE